MRREREELHRGRGAKRHRVHRDRIIGASNSSQTELAHEKKEQRHKAAATKNQITTIYLEAGVVSGGGDFAEGLASDVLRCVGLVGKSDVIDVGGEGEFAAGFGNDVAREAFAVEHAATV